MKIGASEYHYASPTSVEVIARKNNEDPGRRYTVHIDEPCIVHPIALTNQRNRGRECIVRHLKKGKATVEFLDGKGHRFVRVPLCDVIPKEVYRYLDVVVETSDKPDYRQNADRIVQGRTSIEIGLNDHTPL